jgi:hypothetical protein
MTHNIGPRLSSEVRHPFEGMTQNLPSTTYFRAIWAPKAAPNSLRMHKTLSIGWRGHKNDTHMVSR